MDSDGYRSLPQHHLVSIHSGRAVGVLSPGVAKVEDPVTEPQRSQDHSRGDVSMNTKKCGGKGKRGNCPYMIEYTKNKGIEK